MDTPNPAQAEDLSSGLSVQPDGPLSGAVEAAGDLTAWDPTNRGPRMSEATGRVIFKYQMPVLEQFTMMPTGGIASP